MEHNDPDQNPPDLELPLTENQGGDFDSELPTQTSQQKPPFRDMWPYLRKLYDTFGPRRMIYANFYELLIMKDLIPFFTAEDKRWILGKTALSVYRFGKQP